MMQQLPVALPRSAFSLLLWLATVWPAAASAHHSLAAIYDTSRNITSQAVVREFRFINPHPMLIVSVRTGAGSTEIWKAELDTRRELSEIGITKATFKPGDVVVLSGSPGRTEVQILYIWKLERPLDGLLYQQIGLTPYLTVH